MQRQWQYLQRMTELEKIPHAVLFSGPKGTGKRSLALKWASHLLGKEFPKKPAVYTQLHPDLIWITPAGREIHISQIRELIWKFSLHPYSAPLKVAIIHQAHCLNSEAQSSLLKLLEEPRGRALLILITEYPAMLFPTILSRVQVIKFFGIAEREQKPEQKKRIEELEKLRKSDLGFRFQYAKNLSQQDPEVLKKSLEAWLRYCRQILLKDPSNSKIRYNLKLIQTIHHLISTTNLNSRLALELLMLEL